MARGILIRCERVRDIAVGGTVVATQIRTGKEVYEASSLEELQKAVGGLIEAVQLAPGVHGWVNEEGLFNGLPFNDLASILYRTAYPGADVGVVGNMLLMGENADGSEDADLPKEWFDALAADRPLHELLKVGEEADKA